MTPSNLFVSYAIVTSYPPVVAFPAHLIVTEGNQPIIKQETTFVLCAPLLD